VSHYKLIHFSLITLLILQNGQIRVWCLFEKEFVSLPVMNLYILLDVWVDGLDHFLCHYVDSDQFVVDYQQSL
jgi:hypothetical protein